MQSTPPNHATRKNKSHDSRPNFRQRGYNYRWDKLRDRFIRNNPLCRICALQGKVTEAAQVDHIQPHRGDQEKFWDEGNLQALCASCHSRKTAQEVNARR